MRISSLQILQPSPSFFQPIHTCTLSLTTFWFHLESYYLCIHQAHTWLNFHGSFIIITPCIWPQFPFFLFLCLLPWKNPTLVKFNFLSTILSLLMEENQSLKIQNHFLHMEYPIVSLRDSLTSFSSHLKHSFFAHESQPMSFPITSLRKYALPILYLPI
jgi:hypothetical protein